MKKTPKTSRKTLRAKPEPRGLAVGDRVEVSISVADKTGTVTRPAFGRIVALDQVAVVVEGEADARAFEPRKVRTL